MSQATYKYDRNDRRQLQEGVTNLYLPGTKHFKGRGKSRPSLDTDYINFRDPTPNQLQEDKFMKEPDADELFMFILRNFNGTVLIADIEKQLARYFKQGAQALEWLKRTDTHFRVFESTEHKSLSRVLIFRKGYEICSFYFSEKGCNKTNIGCPFLHLCREHIWSNCKDKYCKYNHNVLRELQIQHIGQKTEGIDATLLKTESDALTVMRIVTPQVCEAYNTEAGCGSHENGTCPFIHVCYRFNSSMCAEAACPRNHMIYACADVLKQFGLNKLKLYLLMRRIYVPVSLRTREQSSFTNKHTSNNVEQAIISVVNNNNTTKQASENEFSKNETNPSRSAQRRQKQKHQHNKAENGKNQSKKTELTTGKNVKSGKQKDPLPCKANENEIVKGKSYRANTEDEAPKECTDELDICDQFDEAEASSLFDAILKNHQGLVTIDTLLKNQQTITMSSATEVIQLARNKSDTFRIFENKKKQQFSKLMVYHKALELCTAYRDNDCTSDTCSLLHICPAVIEGHCEDDLNCSFSHDVLNEHNHDIFYNYNLLHLNKRYLTWLVKSSSLVLCQRWMDGGRCKDYNDGCCPYVHVCPGYLTSACNDDHCSKGHSFNAINVRRTLESYFGVVPLIEDQIKQQILIPKTAKKDLVPETTKVQEQRYIHNKDTYICENFVRKQCALGVLCEFHHVPSPYLWQIQRDGKWVDLEQGEQIECAYCEPRTSVFLLETKDMGSVKLHFGDMVLVGDNQFPSILRRLSTKSYVQGRSEKSFLTVWIWYWQNDYGQWEHYYLDDEGPPPDIIEGRFLRRDEFTTMDYTLGGVEFRLHFSNMEQKNIRSGKTRNVCRRPYFVNSSNILDQITPPAPDLRCNIDEFPAHWLPMDIRTKNRPTWEKIQLSKGHPDYGMVLRRFYKCHDDEKKYKVTSIYWIQNLELWKAYTKKKDVLALKLHGEENVKEKKLFHGTSNESVQGICHQNFDPRLSGKNATVYGQGAYFARHSGYSDNYCSNGRERQMFLARVLIGRSAVGNSNYRRPPPVDLTNEQGDLCDSCIDTVLRPSIFVIFERDQCYPEFLICYENLGVPAEEQSAPFVTRDSLTSPPRSAYNGIGARAKTTCQGRPVDTYHSSLFSPIPGINDDTLDRRSRRLSSPPVSDDEDPCFVIRASVKSPPNSILYRYGRGAHSSKPYEGPGRSNSPITGIRADELHMGYRRPRSRLQSDDEDFDIRPRRSGTSVQFNTLHAAHTPPCLYTFDDMVGTHPKTPTAAKSPSQTKRTPASLHALGNASSSVKSQIPSQPVAVGQESSTLNRAPSTLVASPAQHVASCGASAKPAPDSLHALGNASSSVKSQIPSQPVAVGQESSTLNRAPSTLVASPAQHVASRGASAKPTPDSLHALGNASSSVKSQIPSRPVAVGQESSTLNRAPSTLVASPAQLVASRPITSHSLTSVTTSAFVSSSAERTTATNILRSQVTPRPAQPVLPVRNDPSTVLHLSARPISLQPHQRESTILNSQVTTTGHRENPSSLKVQVTERPVVQEKKGKGCCIQ